MQVNPEQASLPGPIHPAPLIEPPSVSQTDGGMPMPLTPLIGRTAELEYIGRVLMQRATRLLVLTGPGGVGKTRLALSAAQAVAEAFDDGLALVNLSPVTKSDLVLPAIADAIGVRGESGASLHSTVIENLRYRDILVLLDNFEQVVSAAPLLTDLLMATTRLTIMVTSRSVLGVYGESVYPVSPFSVPDEEETSLERICRSEAVQLFISRVQAIRPRFQLNERNARDVVTICQRLDGIPLAIELAAARASLFTVANIAERLESRLPLLESGLRNVPDRYRTMRNTIGWSYDLLSPFEQQVFRQLSVFVGPWNLDAAATLVFGTELVTGEQEIALLDAVGSLVDKSLIQRLDTSDHDRNFQVLQILREFGHAELEAKGECEIAEARHTRYILDFANRAQPHLTGREQVAWLNQLELLEADITAVFERLIAADAADSALELMAAVWRYGYARGNILEYRRRLERALARSTAPSRFRAKALNGAGILSNMLGDLASTQRYHEEALEIARAINDKHHMAIALFGLGDLATINNEDAEAEHNYLEAERLYTELDQTRGIATAQTNLGNLYWKQGRLQDALKINEAARRLYESAGDQRGLAWSYTNVGRLSAELRQFGHAAVNLSQAMALYDLIGDRTGIAETLEGYALINVGMREYARALKLLGAADHLRTTIAHPIPLNDRASVDKMHAILRMDAGDVYDPALASGAEMDLDEAMNLALETSVPVDAQPRILATGGETRAIIDRIGITERELDVLQKLGSGETDKEIAERLFISVRTVQTHVQSVLNKFEVTSRSAAVAKAFRIGLLH